MLTDAAWILAGFVTLMLGAELMVRGSVWFALSLGVSKLMVGLTLVAFGTSAPELVVGLSSALEGDYGIATGTVLGSNIANIGLIIGCSAMISPILVAPREVRFELGFTTVAAVAPILPIVLGWGEIDRVFGAVLAAYIIAFTLLLIVRHKRANANRLPTGQVADDPDEDEKLERGPAAVLTNLVWVVLGLAGLTYGGEWLVNGAAGIAEHAGLSQVLVGILIVGPGTSLPELATSISAARKGHSELALGNVLGSNLFNIGMVLGTTALVRPLPILWEEHGVAALTGLGFTLLLLVSMRTRIGVSRTEGALMLLAFVGYLVYEVLTRGTA
ncbi:MAG: calcium/sodium antiporter [Planctomycetes bacterium]|nr:calcium/sodium antiporter [Planctomycetota bacterium]